jgi:HlyD family secretion protein
MPANNSNIELRSDEVQEILGHIPNRIIRYGIVVILSIVLLVFVGSFFFKYPDILPAPVEILSANPPVTVVAKISDNLSQIFVADSQYVNNGDLLGVIKNTAQLSHILYLKQAIYKTKNNLTNSSLSNFPDTLSLGEIQNSYSSFYKQIKEYQQFTQMNILPVKIESLRNKLTELEKYKCLMQKQSAIKEQDYALAQKKYRRDSILYTKEVISLSDLENSKKTLLQNRLSLENTLSTEVNTQIQVQDLQRQIVDLQQEQIKTEQNYQNNLSEQLHNLESKLAWWYDTYLLVSPIDGTVAFNNIWSKNQFVKSGDEVFIVLPRKRTTIIGRAILPVKGAGKVQRGQRVNIKFDNYPYQEFGMLTAQVSTLSLVPSQQNYVVEILLPDSLITNYGYLLPFSQKLQGVAEIITEDLPLIVRLFNPLKAILKKHLETVPSNIVKINRRTVKAGKEDEKIFIDTQPAAYGLKAAELPENMRVENNQELKEIKVDIYYIIAGSFVSKSAVERVKHNFVIKGYNCNILQNERGRFRLSIYSTTLKSKALEKLKTIKSKEKRTDFWILKK